MPRRPLNVRQSRALSRRPPTRDIRKRFLLVCEGEVTEPEYFRHWRLTLRTALIEIEIADEHGVPKSLVETAAARRRTADRAASRQRDDNLRYDEVWCVFDVDEHPRIPAALDQARANGIRVALSNPSFELWALLHFQNQTAYLSRDDARAALQRHLPGYDKRLPAERLLPQYEEARRRARALSDNHVECGGDHADNPSSTVWMLIDAVRQAASEGAQ
jgi:hypothetical protein